MDDIDYIASVLSEDITMTSGLNIDRLSQPYRMHGRHSSRRGRRTVKEYKNTLVPFAHDIFAEPTEAAPYAVMADAIEDVFGDKYAICSAFLRMATELPNQAHNLLIRARQMVQRAGGGSPPPTRRWSPQRPSPIADEVEQQLARFAPLHQRLYRFYNRALHNSGGEVQVKKEETTPWGVVRHRRHERLGHTYDNPVALILNVGSESMLLNFSASGTVSGDPPNNPESAIAFAVVCLFRMVHDPFTEAMELLDSARHEPG